jgi:CRISPR-associated protein Cas1
MTVGDRPVWLVANPGLLVIMRDLHELPKLRDSLSYLYVEHCRIDQKHKAIELFDRAGSTMVPIAALTVFMLGPGTSITHAAIKALADNGCLVNWVGEDGVRFYAQGVGETRKAYHLLRQAELAADPLKRMEVIVRMYRYRFGDQLPTDLNLEQIRGMEGVRVRRAYAEASRKYGVKWEGRKYDRFEWANSDPTNRALSAANACLNSLCHAAIVSGGYSPALGFVHNGKQLSFVYDIADLYKVEITVPLAFKIVAESIDKLETRTRQACRQAFKEAKVLERILPDIDHLLGISAETAERERADAAADMARPEDWWSPDGNSDEDMGSMQINDPDDGEELEE